MDCEPRRLCCAYSVWTERRGSSSNACILALRYDLGGLFTSAGGIVGLAIHPAAQGQLQCYTPDVARRTCRSLAAYKSNAKGAIDNTAIVLISQNPPISMKTVSPVVIKANQVCGLIRPRDIDAASFTLGERPADPAQTATLRKQMQSAMKGFFGHKICTIYVPADGSLLAKVTVDGASQPTMDQRVTGSRRLMATKSVPSIADWRQVVVRLNVHFGWLPALGTRGFQRPLSDLSTDLRVRCHGSERDGRDVPKADAR